MKSFVANGNKDAYSLTVGLFLITVALAAVGFALGGLGRAEAEDPVAFYGALAGGVLFLLLAFLALLDKNAAYRQRGFFIAANVSLFAALTFGVVGYALVSNNTRQPTLSASPRGAFLDVTVKDSGLDAFETIRVEVARVQYRRGKSGVRLTASHPFYSSAHGADGDGKVDDKIRVRLPPGVVGLVRARAFLGGSSRHCNATQNTTGCVVVNVLRQPEAPQLRARWRGSTLLVSVSARDVPARRMTLRAFGLRSYGGRVELAVWRLAPDAGGVFRRQVAIRGLTWYSRVCVVASTRAAAPTRRCPPRGARMRDAWLRYRVPSH